MDHQLEEVLRQVLGTDPEGNLDDDARERLVYATIGGLSDESYRAVWQFSKSIENTFKRSYVQHWLSHKLASRFPFRLAEEIARSIELPYWKWYSVAEVASAKLKWQRNLPKGAQDWSEEAFRLLADVQAHIPDVPDEDRSSIISTIGHILIDANRLDWAEEVASTSEYDPENTDVLLRIAKTRAAQGDVEKAISLLAQVANLATQTHEFHEHPAYDLEEAAGLLVDLGNTETAMKWLAEARVRALDQQAKGSLEGTKCLFGVVEKFAKIGRFDDADDVAKQITVETWRERALKVIEATRSRVSG